MIDKSLLKNKKVIVIGGGGFIGSHLVDVLLDTELKKLQFTMIFLEVRHKI